MSTLAGPIGEVDRAIATLLQARADSGSWNDDQRAAFDRARLDPMEHDGRRLAVALRRGQSDIDAALAELAD